MIDPAALAALSAVLRAGSFEAAAAELNLTQSAVSQRIKTLEERLGTTLVRRSRPATPTATGQRLLRHAEEVGLLERQLSRDLAALLPARDAPLRIAVTADSLASFVVPILARVPGFLYDLVIDDQDASADLLRRGQVAAAITIAGPPVQGCDVTPIGALSYLAFAAPEFFDTWFADGVTADALGKAPALTFNRKDKLQERLAERITGQKVRLRTHYIGTTDGITLAACAGLGWAANPAPLVQPHLESGALVELAPGLRLDTPLVWQVPRQNREALQELTRELKRG